MSLYLSYDIPSIQKLVFRVPKLKCIIGASSQVVDFDDFVKKTFPKSKLVFAGGVAQKPCLSLNFNTIQFFNSNPA